LFSKLAVRCEQTPRTSGDELAWLEFIDVAPDPGFSRFNRANERVFSLMEVLRSMLVFRRVTAAHVSTNQAQPQMDPGIASLGALFADVLTGLPNFNLVEVRAFFHLSSDQRV
jgi:hypothetical protein